jgi:hypothetical protein
MLNQSNRGEVSPGEDQGTENLASALSLHNALIEQLGMEDSRDQANRRRGRRSFLRLAKMLMPVD